MKSTNRRSQSPSAHLNPVSHIIQNTSRGLLLRIGAVLALTALVISAFYSSSSASNFSQPSKNKAAPAIAKALGVPDRASSLSTPSFSPFLSPVPQFGGESLATYASDCTTPKSTFAVGEAVCVVAAGVPLSAFFPRHLTWSTTDSSVVRSTDIISDPQIDSLTITATSLVAGQTIDNRGTWTLVIRNPFFFFPEAIARFTVTDPAHATADLGITTTFSADSVQTGSQTSFGLQVNNYGPNNAVNVSLTDAVPAGTSLVTFAQLTGPTFTCNTASGLTTCTLASMTANDAATFLATYQVNSGTEVTNTAIVTSNTQDLNGLNNTISVTTPITGAGSGCTLSCPGPIVSNNDSGQGGHSIPAANFPSATASGASCGAVTLSVSPNPQNNTYFFPIGTSFVTAETESGETCTFTVTINDVENPTVTCPADISTFESSPGSGTRAVSFNVVATDNSGSATVNCDHPSGSNFSVGTTPVVCTATDAAGNTSSSCTFNVTVDAINSTCVLNTQPPIVVNSDSNACGTHVMFATPTSDGSGTCGTVTCDHGSGSFFGEGDTLVTCTSQPDGATTSFTVTVNDTTAPVPNLSSLPTNTKDCTANAGVATTIQTPNGPKIIFEPPTATDNCGGQIEGSTSDPRVYIDPGTYTVHWTYTDPSGNSSSQDQTVVVTGTDVTAPVPDVANLPTVTAECTATIPGPPTATDDCDGTLTGTTPDALTYTGVGTYIVHWTYTDQAGHSVSQNQTVIVTDTHNPTIALVGANPIIVECHTSFSDPGVTTTDNCVPKNVTVNTTGTVNVNVPNTYTLTYTATDGGGNQASVQRTVIVQDTIAPTINCPGNIANVPTETGTCAAHVNAGTPTASDSCDSSVTITAVRSDGLTLSDAYPKGLTTITWTATDDSGNHSSCQQTITVIDTEPPAITCAADVIVDFDPAVNGAVVTYTAPVGTDNCPGATTTQIAGLPSGSTFPTGITTNTFKVTDAVGLTATCSFKVTVALTSVIGLDAATLSGNGLLDSYDSTGGYPATKDSLAKLLSNGTVSVLGSSKMFGSVRSTRVGVTVQGTSQVNGNATAGTTVSKGVSAVITGTITNNLLAPVMTLPSVSTCGPPYSPNSGISGTYSYNSSTGDLTLSGINVATLANGIYCFHNLSLTNSAQLKVNGPVTIKLTGTLSASGATSVTNTTAIPANLRILSSYTGSNGVTFSNGTSIYMLLYAPTTNVTNSGSAPIFGTLVGKTVTVSNSGNLHYDTQLKNIWPALWPLIF